MSDLDTLNSALTSVTSTFTDYVKDRILTATNAILKLKALKDVNFADDFGDALGSVDDLGDAIRIASELGEAFAENPLVAQLTNKLQDQYGWDMSSSMSVVKAIISGQSHPLINVVSACIQTPVRTRAHVYLIEGIIDDAEKMVEAIKVKYPNGLDIPGAITEVTELPEGVYNDVTIARQKLAYALQSNPVSMTNYNQSIILIDEAISELSTIDIRSAMDSALEAGASAAFIMIFNGLGDVITERYRSEKQARDKFKETHDVIVNTNIQTSSNDAALARPAKALADLSKIHRDMINPNLTQSTMIPEYILTLGAIKQVLKLSTPIEPDPSVPGEVYTNQSITFNFATTNNMARVLARIYTFTRSPSNTQYLEQAVADARVYLDALILEYENFENQVSAFLLGPANPIVEIINKVAGYLESSGLDAAKTAFENGDISSAMQMDEFSGTTYGAAFTAIDEIAKMAMRYNLFDVQKFIDKMKPDLKKKAEAKKLDNDSKKKEKVAKLKATVDGALSSIDELVTLGEEITGMIDAITSITVV